MEIVFTKQAIKDFEKVKQNLNKVYDELDEILKEEEILKLAQKLLKYNKSKMVIMKVEGNDFINLFVKVYKKSLLNIKDEDSKKSEDI